MYQDWINGGFEMVGAYCAWMNAWKLRKDREIKGVFWPVWVFYTTWGLWNLHYYPSLDQWASFAAGAVLTAGNIVWVSLAIKYRKGGK